MSIANVQARPQQIVRGVTLILAAMFVTSVQDVVFKLFSNELTLWQIFTLRGLLALPLLFTLAWMRGIKDGVLLDALRKWTLLRSLFMTLCFLAFYAAIPFLSLSTVGAANYIAPIFVTLMSAYLISEPVGRLRWIAVLIGFVGVIFLLQPGTDAFSPWAVLPVIGACFYALSHITTRAKCQSIPLPIMALSLNIVMLTAGLIASGILLFWQPEEELIRSYPSLLSSWSVVGASEWLILGLLAIFAVVIGLGIAGAYQAASPPIVATFEYSYLVFVAVWDYLFFCDATKWRNNFRYVNDYRSRVDGFASLMKKLHSKRRGFLTSFLNSKGLLMYLAVLPQFISPVGNVAFQAMSLSLFFIVGCGFIYTFVGLLAARAHGNSISDKLRRRFETIAGILLVGAAVKIATQHQ